MGSPLPVPWYIRVCRRYGYQRSLTRWFRDKLSPDLVAAEKSGGENGILPLSMKLKTFPPVQKGLWCYRISLERRTPINDPLARGMFFGLTLAHQRGHLFKAVLEGMGYGVRQHFDVMDEIRCQT
jgi:xylulokinase